MPIVKNSETHNVIKSYFSSGILGIWIALTYRASSWLWVKGDGSTEIFREDQLGFWGSGEPNSLGTEKCTVTTGQKQKWIWNNLMCEYKYQVLCQKPKPGICLCLQFEYPPTFELDTFPIPQFSASINIKLGRV